MAAVEVAARAPVVMVETTPAAIGDGVQRPAVLAIGWRQVASAAEMTAAEAASAMAEAVVVMVVAAAAVVAGGRAGQDSLVGRHGSALRCRSDLGFGHSAVRWPSFTLRCRSDHTSLSF